MKDECRAALRRLRTVDSRQRRLRHHRPRDEQDPPGLGTFTRHVTFVERATHGTSASGEVRLPSVGCTVAADGRGNITSIDVVITTKELTSRQAIAFSDHRRPLVIVEPDGVDE
ncbi:hypothetical protein ACGFJ7_09665 [Actinoplanes sp. NPDC048988]|uniref:hypothetical protein n=1 Tax=Actinoplanes sp. NPDC048988 TaxID=3363901 RepID=UPI00371B09AA